MAEKEAHQAMYKKKRLENIKRARLQKLKQERH